jgi:hypothetical protein
MQGDKPRPDTLPCSICSRQMWVEESVRIGIGPICRAKIAENAEAEAQKTCAYKGCLLGADHIPTLLERARRWILNVAEWADEPLPDQVKMLLTMGQINRALTGPFELNPECPRKEHLAPPDRISGLTWLLVSWMQHKVEPWMWVRHRDLLAEVDRMYQHLRNILELIGLQHEAEVVAAHENARRKGRNYRKKLYRYIEMFPVS